MTNEYAAPCHRCGTTVEIGDGHVMGKPGTWIVEHRACVPVADPTRYGRPAKLRNQP